MGLRDKYSYAIQTAKDLRMQGSADERDGKLYFHGTVGTEAKPTRSGTRSRRFPTGATTSSATSRRPACRRPCRRQARRKALTP